MSYAGLSDSDRKKMMTEIGISSIDELFADIPKDIQINSLDGLPGPVSEIEIERMASIQQKRNMLYKKNFTGAGAYNHYVPPVVDEIASRSEFYTSYTPYQPEVSQGTLCAIFEFQTMISRLNGMDLTNASMYDGATAMAEAAMMAVRINGRRKVLVSRSVHPNYRDVLKTYSWASGFEINEINLTNGLTDLSRCGELADDEISAIIIQSPNFFGLIEDVSVISEIKKKGTILIHVVVEALSLGVLKGGGELGADIVCGEV